MIKKFINIKKIGQFLLTSILIFVFAFAFVVSADFPDDYPSSSKWEGIAAPTDGVLLQGELIGEEIGWGDNAYVGRAAAFDGILSTFYDPAVQGVPSSYCGIELSEPYILTEIRICPRIDFLNRFQGAAIYGFNDSDGNDGGFDPYTATLIWKSNEEAYNQGFQIITAEQFRTDSNTGFTRYAYFNEIEHGDVAEIEFYGNPASGAVVSATVISETAAELTKPEEDAVQANAEGSVSEKQSKKRIVFDFDIFIIWVCFIAVLVAAGIKIYKKYKTK